MKNNVGQCVDFATIRKYIDFASCSPFPEHKKVCDDIY